jgi:hypothetical protein
MNEKFERFYRYFLSGEYRMNISYAQYNCKEKFTISFADKYSYDIHYITLGY